MIFGIDSAFSFHVVNVVLHGISTILFTQICTKVVKFKTSFATLCGILFALHPIHTESKLLYVKFSYSREIFVMHT